MVAPSGSSPIRRFTSDGARATPWFASPPPSPEPSPASRCARTEISCSRWARTPTTRTSGGSTTSPAWREAPVGRTRLLEVGRTGRSGTGRSGTVVRRAQPPPPRIRRPRVAYERLARRWRARFAGNLFSCFLCFRAVSCTWARCRSCCNTARAIMTCSRRSRRRPGASRWDRGTPRAWRGSPAGGASARMACGGAVDRPRRGRAFSRPRSGAACAWARGRSSRTATWAA